MKTIPIRKLSAGDHISPPSESFKIRKVQDILGGNNLQHHLHRHDFFFVLLLQRGSGRHEIDFTNYEVTDYSIFFLRPGQVHYLELFACCTGFLMEFNNEFYHPQDKVSSERLRKATSKNFCKLQEERFEKLQQILGHIFQEFTSREEGYLDVIKANLEIFFIIFIRESKNANNLSRQSNSYTQERLEEFLGLLEMHVKTCKQVSEYTHRMSLSTYQLNEITKASIGKTPSELINQQIILEAKRYLLATPNQIKDIADHLGYEDVSYFIRFFKKHTQHSPEAFRHNRG